MLPKRPDYLSQMDAFPKVTLVNKAAFELQDRTSVRETILFSRGKVCDGQKVSILLKSNTDIIL